MRLIATVLLCCISLITAQGAVAMQVSQDGVWQAGGETGREFIGLDTFQGGGLTLSQAVEQVRRQYKGQIVSAETKVRGKQEIHIIKVLTEDGKVKTVQVPGRRLN